MCSIKALSLQQLLMVTGGEATANAPGTLPPPVTEPEGNEYGSISNVLKTKHDTAKNSVSNIR